MLVLLAVGIIAGQPLEVATIETRKTTPRPPHVDPSIHFISIDNLDSGFCLVIEVRSASNSCTGTHILLGRGEFYVIWHGGMEETRHEAA